MGLLGTTNGSFFEAPDWVDKKKKPGFTDQSPVYPELGLKWFVSWVNPWNFFVNSPNFVWFIVALMTYIICPYDLEAAKEITYDGLGKQFIYRSVGLHTPLNANHHRISGNQICANQANLIAC
jgi:hypothetical protein